MRLPSLLSVVLLIVGVCHALPLSFDDVREDNDEKDAWLAGVFRPQPLRPAPWQSENPEAAPTPTSSGALQLPGVGELHGRRGYKTIKNRPIDAFLGVRYAQLNAGGLGRFQAAGAVPYQGTIDATRSSANCAQFPEVQRLQEAEARGENVDDCLTLDIYAPAGARDLPVLVFVHGEMLFDGGAEEAQPDYVLEHDVILVSVNYRLAPFGFLSALSEELPGNVALSDLHLALEWVQRNVRYFGGDASQVTLIGQAGGATLSHALSLSPRTQHLFQKLILQSGTALNPYLIDERPLDTLTTFARLARCPVPGRNLGALYECLRGLSTSQLVSAFEQLLQQNEPRGLSALGGFKLVIGDPLGYLPEHPAALVASNSNNNITKPLIVGAAKDAGAFILSRFYDQIQGLQSQNLSDYINVVLRHTAPPQHHKIWHDWALREIFGPEQQRYVSARSVTQGLLELSNLILYRAPVINSIQSSYKKSPAYLYTFDYRGEHHRFGHLNNPLPFGVDASLSDDSVYLFPYPIEASQLNPEDLSLARALTAMWVNFAQTGIPNPNANVWPKASSEYGPFLRFTNSRENTLELDQHFGEGINIPNLYPQYFKVNATAATPSPVPTTPTYSYEYTTPPTTPPPYYVNTYTAPRRYDTTTTTTTPPPYVVNTYTPRQPVRQPPNRNWRPMGTHYTRVQQMELELEQKRLRALQERDERARQEQQQREQQQREQQQREQQQREQQQREQQQREQQQREQLEREEAERRREQQQLEQQQRREQFEREQLEREQLEREQQQREQYDRNQPDGEPSQENVPSVDASDPYEELARHEEEERRREQQQREQLEQNQWQNPQPQEDDQLREEQLRREQAEREQYERDQSQRVPYEGEQQQETLPQEDDVAWEQQREAEQRRLQAERDQYERDQRLREQYEREQQQREQFEQNQIDAEPSQETEPQVDERDPYEEQRRQQEEEQRREQQLRDQYEREQQEREPAQESEPQEDDREREQQKEEQLRREWQERQQYEQERRRQQEQQQREQQQQGRESQEEHQEEDNENQEWDQRQREQLEREQQEREQQRREQAPREQQEREGEPQPTQPEGPQVHEYPTYEEYIEAYNAWISQQANLYNPESYASQEEEQVTPVDEVPENPYSDDY